LSFASAKRVSVFLLFSTLSIACAELVSVSEINLAFIFASFHQGKEEGNFINKYYFDLIVILPN
jgi:hypothetical protein